MTSVRRGAVRAMTAASRGPLRPVSKHAMRLLFNQVAPRWERIRADPSYRNNFLAGLQQCPMTRPPHHILDIACGTGIAARALLDTYPDAEILGLDISPAMLDIAQQMVPEAVFVEGSSFDLPFADQSFDLVCSLDGMFDIDEMVRVCAPGGSIYIAYTHENVPIYQPLEKLRQSLENAGAQASTHIGPGHYVWAVRSPAGP